MPEESYSLDDLAEAVGIAGRTIRSYIERGLLPGAQTRGRAASYSAEHLSRLEVIKSLRRARPNITLSEIRAVFEAIWDVRLDGANFRRKLSADGDWLVPTGRRAAPGADGGKPAELF